MSSPADTASRRDALLPVLGHRERAFRARRCGPDLLRWRLGPGRLGRRGLGLAGRALRPKRHAAQPHEVGLGTQPPPSPHRARYGRADLGPLRGSAQRQNLRGPKKVRSNKPFVGPGDSRCVRAPCSSGSPGPSAGPLAASGVRVLAQRAARRGGRAAGSPARSTLHPPGRCPERLQDRQRVGAGNYKSNPSSRGVKLQRKRTSKGKKRPERSDSADSRARRAQILEAAKVTRKKPESKQKSPPQTRGRSSRGSPGVPRDSDAPAAAEEPGGGARGRGEPPV